MSQEHQPVLDVIEEEESIHYEEHSWPPEEPNGYSFKGKGFVFVKASRS